MLTNYDKFQELEHEAEKEYLKNLIKRYGKCAFCRFRDPYAGCILIKCVYEKEEEKINKENQKWKKLKNSQKEKKKF